MSAADRTDDLIRMLRENSEQLMRRTIELGSLIADLQAENASLRRSMDSVVRMFRELDSEQAFHDAAGRAGA